MKFSTKRLLQVGVPLVVVGVAAWAIFYVPGPGWSSNDITTGETLSYPDLISRRYDVPVSTATIFAAQAAQRLTGWTVRRTDPNTGIVEVEIRVPALIGLFRDDLTVTVLPDKEVALVKIHSRSRVGSGDLGENARHIRALQAAMDQRLPLAD